jgi:hypothetical protein
MFRVQLASTLSATPEWSVSASAILSEIRFFGTLSCGLLEWRFGCHDKASV